jgi:hypothetical protein
LHLPLHFSFPWRFLSRNMLHLLQKGFFLLLMHVLKCYTLLFHYLYLLLQLTDFFIIMFLKRWVVSNIWYLGLLSFQCKIFMITLQVFI